MPTPLNKQISSRIYVITPADNGMILELGPAATASSVGVFSLQFNPDATSDFSVAILGRIMGQAAMDAGVPYLPIPYKQVTMNNVAKDYSFAQGVVTGPSKIQIPSNGDAIALLVSCSVGKCVLVSWDLQGPAAV